MMFRGGVEHMFGGHVASASVCRTFHAQPGWLSIVWRAGRGWKCFTRPRRRHASLGLVGDAFATQWVWQVWFRRSPRLRIVVVSVMRSLMASVTNVAILAAGGRDVSGQPSIVVVWKTVFQQL